MGTPTLRSEWRASLIGIVGAAHVLEGVATRGYAVDWTGRFEGSTPAVVRPGSVEEVAAVVRWCNTHRVALVPQRGNTGLVGGSVPLQGELVLSLRRLDRLQSVDLAAQQVTAGAGVTLGALQAHAAAAGLRYPVDLAARDSATLGGTIATNAGGMHVLRHGATRAQLRGVEAVLGDGSIVSHLGGLEKDNTGYDIAGLLCGSEGTLGIVTAARVRLIASPTHTVVALLGFDDLASALGAAREVQRLDIGLEAAEIFFADGLALVCESLHLAPPFAGDRPAVYLLLEVAGVEDPTERLAKTLSGHDQRLVAVATDAARRSALWRYREAHTEAINLAGPPHKFDVTLPLGSLAEFAAAVPARIAEVEPAAQCWLFGHLLDGNLHVNVTGVDPGDERVDGAVLTLVAERGGSISAEHGIGRAKRPYLHLSRSETELAAFRAIKGALDPNGILNPGVLI